ncbi:MAG: hypothetical protein AB1568_03390 [Thermodesulfobacteriota bacterium]
MDPDKIMDHVTEELSAALKAMAKAKTLEEKVAYSHIVKNMSESLGVFLNLATDMMGEEFMED